MTSSLPPSVCPVSRAGSGRAKKETSDEEPMQTDEYVPGPRENPLYTAEPLTLEDLTLLAELFYLPYEYGPTALIMLQELHWLRSNSTAATFSPVLTEDIKVRAAVQTSDNIIIGDVMIQEESSRNFLHGAQFESVSRFK